MIAHVPSIFLLSHRIPLPSMFLKVAWKQSMNSLIPGDDVAGSVPATTFVIVVLNELPHLLWGFLFSERLNRHFSFGIFCCSNGCQPGCNRCGGDYGRCCGAGECCSCDGHGGRGRWSRHWRRCGSERSDG